MLIVILKSTYTNIDTVGAPDRVKTKVFFGAYLLSNY
ncbi:hypothetical protein BN990_03965 [Virgibacillus salexigens]|uniref:Uncharacterized protein n=1 Tax=Virgibacillus massiliensis TaxID=1462526 RepID=A0A024QI21_9BACI|nr:hypothetical protein BN990_03965 [Virgibacillus massiliensis]